MPESRNGPRCRLIVFGAGGHAKVVIDAAERSGRFEVAGILDDNPASWGTDIFGYRVIGNISSIRHHGCEAIVAIGSNYARERIGREFANRGIELATIVHPRAQLSRGVRIGSGTVLMAGSIVNADTCLGSAVIINTGATVDHDCRIGNAVHIAPGVTICGGVMIGGRVLVGAGATICPGVVVGDDAIIGAGACATRPVTAGSTVVGTPARPLCLPQKHRTDRLTR